MNQTLVRFLNDLRGEIATNTTPNHYYYLGQIDLLDRLIVTIGEGHFNRTGSVQEGTAALPTGVSEEPGGEGEADAD